MRFRSDAQRRAVFASMFSGKRKVDPKILSGLIDSDQGLTQKDLATYFGVTGGSVGNVIRLHDIPYDSKRVNVPEGLIDAIKSYIDKNPFDTVVEIADAMGMKPTVLRNIIARRGIPYRRKTRKIREDVVAAIRVYIRENPSADIDQVADHFDRTFGSIEAIIRRYNIPFDLRVGATHRVAPLTGSELEERFRKLDELEWVEDEKVYKKLEEEEEEEE